MSQKTFAISRLIAVSLTLSLPVTWAVAADDQNKSKSSSKDEKDAKVSADAKGKADAKSKDEGKPKADLKSKDDAKSTAEAKPNEAEKKANSHKRDETNSKVAAKKGSDNKASETKGSDAKASDAKQGVKQDANADGKNKALAELQPRELTLLQLQEALLRVKGKGTLNISAAPDPKYRSTYVPRNSIAPRKPTHSAAATQGASQGVHANSAPSAAVMPVYVNAAGVPVNANGVPIQLGQPGGTQLFALQPMPETSVSREYIRARAASLSERSSAVLGPAAVGPAALGMTTSIGLAAHGKPGVPSSNGAPGAGGGQGASAAGGGAHWAYEGEHGPQAWASLKPEYSTCTNGTRQSPINIEDDSTLQGPAEPLNVRYTPSTGSVVNNGHTIQVDVRGDNVLSVRGTDYKLLQFHAHHPAEERINGQGFAMVMHLVHRANDGRLAVIAVLLDPGESNPLVQKVWTHMPLDVMDRVRLPADLLNLNELLPQDRRYYQFMGSLTTPPCTEGVLWIVIKQPVGISQDQLRLFSQVFPMNARPVQPAHGRVVRSGQ